MNLKKKREEHMGEFGERKGKEKYHNYIVISNIKQFVTVKAWAMAYRKALVLQAQVFNIM